MGSRRAPSCSRTQQLHHCLCWVLPEMTPLLPSQGTMASLGTSSRPTGRLSVPLCILPFPAGVNHQASFLDPRITIAFLQVFQAGPGCWCCEDAQKDVVFPWLRHSSGCIPLSCKITSPRSALKPEHLCSRLFHESVFFRGRRYAGCGNFQKLAKSCLS